MKTKKEIADWLRTTAKEMYEEDEAGMAHIFLDEYHDCCLAVGWLGGYEPETGSTDYHSRNSKGYALNAAIVKYNPADCCDLEWSEMPYYPESGEVWNTGCTLGSDTDYDCLARFYIKEYKSIMKEIEKGTLITTESTAFSNKSQERR